MPHAFTVKVYPSRAARGGFKAVACVAGAADWEKHKNCGRGDGNTLRSASAGALRALARNLKETASKRRAKATRQGSW